MVGEQSVALDLSNQRAVSAERADRCFNSTSIPRKRFEVVLMKPLHVSHKDDEKVFVQVAIARLPFSKERKQAIKQRSSKFDHVYGAPL